MGSSNRLDSVHETMLIVEGGALRSVFSLGLLDRFLKDNFNPFDSYIGVSAGASNLAAFLSGAPCMNLNAYLDLVLDKELISYWRFLRGGHLIDLDWLFEKTFSKALLDIPAIFSHNRSFYIGLTDVVSGEAEYVMANPKNLFSVIKASTALPLFYRGFPEVDGRPMADGGVADGIPIQQAIRLGAKRIMVVLSRSDGYRKTDTWVHRYIRWRMRKHPLLVATMRERVEQHKAVIKLIHNPPPGVCIVAVCPPAHFAVDRFTRDRDSLLRGYQIGFDAAEAAIVRWRMLQSPSDVTSDL